MIGFVIRLCSGTGHDDATVQQAWLLLARGERNRCIVYWNHFDSPPWGCVNRVYYSSARASSRYRMLRLLESLYLLFIQADDTYSNNSTVRPREQLHWFALGSATSVRQLCLQLKRRVIQPYMKSTDTFEQFRYIVYAVTRMHIDRLNICIWADSEQQRSWSLPATFNQSP